MVSIYKWYSHNNNGSNRKCNSTITKDRRQLWLFKHSMGNHMQLDSNPRADSTNITFSEPSEWQHHMCGL